MNSILPASFYKQDTIQVARHLLGKQIIREIDGHILSGFIVETEAYTTDDPASHAYRGITARNAPMFGPVGHAYVYFVYGNHYCFNVVAKDTLTKAGAILVRAIEPCDGIEQMTTLRNGCSGYNMSNGPGKLTQALDINHKLNNAELTKSGPLYLTQGIDVSPTQIESSQRIGIKVGIDKLWRFSLKNNRWLSR